MSHASSRDESETLPVFERYEAVARLGSGGMAVVYVVRLRGEGGFEKLLAIKQLRDELSQEPDFVKMFLDEARLAAQIVSPHVVGTHDLGRTPDGRLFLVMDLVLGASARTLRKHAADAGARLPLSSVIELIAQAAEGLHHAHEAVSWRGKALDIVHRDVSPDNILVGVDGIARISDFGVARARERLTETQAGVLKGKIAYTAPEALKGSVVDRRADLFSLGVVLWELACDTRLFNKPNPVLTLRAVVDEPIPSPERHGVAPALARVILQSLDRRPSERFQTGAEMATALRGAAADARLQASRAELGGLVRMYAGTSINELIERLKIPTLPPISVVEALPTDPPSSGALRRTDAGRLAALSNEHSDADADADAPVTEVTPQADIEGPPSVAPTRAARIRDHTAPRQAAAPAAVLATDVVPPEPTHPFARWLVRLGYRVQAWLG